MRKRGPCDMPNASLQPAGVRRGGHRSRKLAGRRNAGSRHEPGRADSLGGDSGGMGRPAAAEKTAPRGGGPATALAGASQTLPKTAQVRFFKKN